MLGYLLEKTTIIILKTSFEHVDFVISKQCNPRYNNMVMFNS